MVKYKCYGDTGREGKKWEDELLAGVMAWCLVHWTASLWAQALCSKQKFAPSIFFFLHVGHLGIYT